MQPCSKHDLDYISIIHVYLRNELMEALGDFRNCSFWTKIKVQEEITHTYHSPQSNEHIQCSQCGTMHRSSITTLAPFILSYFLSLTCSLLRLDIYKWQDTTIITQGPITTWWSSLLSHHYEVKIEYCMMMSRWHQIWHSLSWMWWSSPTTPTSMNKCMCNPHKHREYIQCLKSTISFFNIHM